MQLVISAFPGCGKSTICKEAEQYGLVHVPVSLEGTTSNRSTDGKTPIFDSDSSLFAKEHFPGNYIEHIKEVLKNHPDVVIMVSSHDNVREAMREAGIEYTLVAPQRELKGEYLERYQGRGSPEAFITMMENKWNDFIDSIENDPSTSKLVLSEGEYLVDKISDRIKETVKNMSLEGNESIDGFKDIFTGATNELKAVIANDPPVTITEDGSTAGTTAVIIDVNADANNPDVIQPEASGEVIVGIVNQPESIEDSTLTAGKLEGGVIAVDASTVDNPALAGNEDLELAEMKVEWAEQDRADLIEAKFDIQNDIDALEGIVAISKDETHTGFESLVDNSEILVAAADNINLRYGSSVEPTMAGMESFLDTLKKVFTKTDEKLKEAPTKQQLGIIKKYIFENEKAAALYISEKWQSEQKFINVGKAKIQVPGFLASADSPASAKAILDMVNQRVKTTFTKYYKNSTARTAYGMKIFNALKGKDPEEGVGLIDEKLPITPEELTGAIAESGLKDLNIKPQSVELPVLNKDKIKEVVDIMNSITDLRVEMNRMEESGFDNFIDDEDWNKSKFWDKFDNTKQALAVWNVVSFEGDTPEFDYLSSEYNTKILAVAKFLESWILASVK